MTRRLFSRTSWTLPATSRAGRLPARCAHQWSAAVRAVCAAALMGLAACSGGGDGGPDLGDVDVSASPSEQRVAQGASTLFTVTVRRTNVTGPVSLSVDPGSVPTGVTVEFDPQTLPAGATQSIARVSVSPTAPVQYVPEPPLVVMPIFATGPDGLRDQSALHVRVVPSSLAGITLNVTPADLPIDIGGTKEAIVTVARQGNYTGAVAVAVALNTQGFSPQGAAEIERALSPAITPAAGAPDTWVLRFFADNTSPETLLSLVRTAGLVGGVSFVVRATPQGLTPVTASVNVPIVLPIFNPRVNVDVMQVFASTEQSVAMTMRRSFRFTAPITMEVDSGPIGISGTFAPNPVVDDATTLTVRAAANVAPGSYMIRVRGTPTALSGASEQLLRVPVRVGQPYTLAVPNITVAAGSQTSAPFSMDPGEFEGNVNVGFSQAGGTALPQGMSITLDEQPVFRNTTLRLTTTSATPVGTYQLRAVGTATNGPTVTALFTVAVTSALSNVARIQMDPLNAEITAPATAQFGARLYDASGAEITAESGGQIQYVSSQPAVASQVTGGVMRGNAPGTTTIVASYVRNGTTIVQTSTPLLVYAAGTAGHYGSIFMSAQGNARTIRRGESITFQLIVRTPAGVQVTSGVAPQPTVTSSNSGVIRIDPIAPPFGLTGYFYDMTAAFDAAIGAEVRIRFDVTGAGGEVVVRVVPTTSVREERTPG